MIDLKTSTSLLFYARLAGVLYLFIIACGIYSEVFVRSELIVDGDAAATVANILASKARFLTAFVADSVMLLSDVAIAVVLYVLLKPVHRILALSAAVFRLVQASILGLNLLHYYAVSLLLDSRVHTNAFDSEEVNDLVMLLLEMHSYGYDLGLLFFALSCFILGYLVIKADYFPSVLGYGLLAAAFVYFIGSYTRFLFPELLPWIEPLYIIAFITELSFCLWLLIRGIKH
ncbi:DUF4386 domain-containing protein [Sulfurovum sp. zt1-1]|uniref:DUF4386 domain-containing protein n=1 Tax=Sulfurovum zhangzhouensis TaxID=3019067 RepID=A0ABT7QYK4_9BACT|nr:DUF4386 domain-containing protein [Sulfurovum zhangzhouensis]MDM5271916.1 DUF4386 domain-containing protein [Sulfurovum zhangzhouensis]